MFLSSIQQLLEVYGKGENTEVYEHAFTELVKVACHSEQTYLYTQAMLHVMAEKVCYSGSWLTTKTNRLFRSKWFRFRKAERYRR